mmetsp:Transcript_70828/g.153828  ORF Transcript_70828/g.153828 Transcript_70828/m.153828 type:complete len:337 (-) Transcript_70828:226-1236(-)
MLPGGPRNYGNGCHGGTPTSQSSSSPLVSSLAPPGVLLAHRNMPQDIGSMLPPAALKPGPPGSGSSAHPGAPSVAFPPGGATNIVPNMTQLESREVSVQDLPFSNASNKALWRGLVDLMNQGVNANLPPESPEHLRRTPRAPLPEVSEEQLGALYDSYVSRGCEELLPEQASLMFRDMQCAVCLALHLQQNGLSGEARGTSSGSRVLQTGTQISRMELQMARARALEELPEEVILELLDELDADSDGKVSRADFVVTARGVILDLNPLPDALETSGLRETGRSGFGLPFQESRPSLTGPVHSAYRGQASAHGSMHSLKSRKRVIPAWGGLQRDRGA